MSGCCWLVGAGPGDVRFLTQEVRNCLGRAEVLVYDALVDERVLDLVPPSCERLDVGKRGGGRDTPQTEINRLLVERTRQSAQVVRLKAGDPFIFGRAASEMEALREAGCRFHVLAGLSSALAAPLLAGIPLTDPVLSRGFGCFTAHDPDALDWETLAHLDTLVLLMGGRQLPELVQQLIQHGCSGETPVAIIRWAGQPEQRIWSAPLGRILAATAGEELAPCVIVVGEVVRLREYWHAPTDD